MSLRNNRFGITIVESKRTFVWCMNLNTCWNIHSTQLNSTQCYMMITHTQANLQCSRKLQPFHKTDWAHNLNKGKNTTTTTTLVFMHTNGKSNELYVSLKGWESKRKKKKRDLCLNYATFFYRKLLALIQEYPLNECDGKSIHLVIGCGVLSEMFID